MRWWVGLLLEGCSGPADGPLQRRGSPGTNTDTDTDTDTDTGERAVGCPFAGGWAISAATCGGSPVTLTGTASVVGTADLCDVEFVAAYENEAGGYICNHTEAVQLQAKPMGLWEGFTELRASDCWAPETRPMGFVDISVSGDGILLEADGRTEDGQATGFYILGFCLSSHGIQLEPAP